jgi:hypothetical protein
VDVIRVSQPAELLALIPYRLGFQPAESLVAVSIRPGGTVGLIARLDLGDAHPQVLHTLAAHLTRDGARHVTAAVYTAREDTARQVLAVARAHLSQGVQVASTWWVSPSAYTETSCTDPTCCPRPVSDLTGTQVAAHMTYAGHTVAATRPSALPRVQASEQDQATAQRARALRLGAHRTLDPDALALALATWNHALTTRPGAHALGEISAALAVPVVRDALILHLVDADADAQSALEALLAKNGPAPGPRAHTAIDVLHAVAAHTPGPEAAAPLAAAAWLYWWAGDGVRASLAVDAALEIDPGHRLARLIGDTVAAGLPPGWARP